MTGPPTHDPAAPCDVRTMYPGLTAGQLADAATQGTTPPGTQQSMYRKPDCGETSYRGTGRLANRTALVTGGDSGIGRAVAIAFAREGADVAIAYWKDEEAADAKEVEQLVRDAGRKAHVLQADLASEAGVDAVVESTMGAFGRIDIAVLNASIQTVAEANWTKISRADIERTVATNWVGTFRLIQKIAPQMQADRGPAIIVTSSIQGSSPSAALAHYASTKAAQINLVSSLAPSVLSEFGARLCTVCPGPVYTPLVASSYGASKLAAFGSDYPIGRAAQPAELAGAYVFLADPRAASYVAGSVLAVTGGAPM